MPKKKEIAHKENKDIKVVNNIASLLSGRDDPENALEVAKKYTKVLVDIIENQKLYSEIQKRKYIRVEGWTALAGMVGVFPHTEYSKRLERGATEIAYEAKVIMKNIHGLEVASAEAMCSNHEDNKKNQPEYAIKSMSITRATGKACRLAFSWIIALAGYETTPAEEMDGVKPSKPSQPQKPPAQPPTELATPKQIALIEKQILGSHLAFPFDYFFIDRQIKHGMTKAVAKVVIDMWLKTEHPVRVKLEKKGEKYFDEYCQQKFAKWMKSHPQLVVEYNVWVESDWKKIVEKRKET